MCGENFFSERVKMLTIGWSGGGRFLYVHMYIYIGCSVVCGACVYPPNRVCCELKSVVSGDENFFCVVRFFLCRENFFLVVNFFSESEFFFLRVL